MNGDSRDNKQGDVAGVTERPISAPIAVVVRKNARGRMRFRDVADRLQSLTTRELAESLFEQDWYFDLVKAAGLAEYGQEWSSDGLIDHYVSVGSKLGLAPVNTFSPGYYRQRYGVDTEYPEPLEHYLKVGKGVGNQPHPLLDADTPLDIRSGISDHATRMFDASFYLNTYPDVAEAGVDPLLHYLTWGWREKRTPHPLFDVAFYISQLEATENPTDLFLHYLTEGWQRGLSPHPIFDPAYYRTFQGDDEGKISPLEHYAFYGARRGYSTHRLFDVGFYRSHFSPGNEPRDAILHYLKEGAADRLDSHPLFDGHYALTQGGYSGSRAPLVTYLLAPFSGRAPHPLFDVQYYLSQARAKNRVISDPLSDYVEFGAAEKLAPHHLFDPVFYEKQFEGEPHRASYDLMHYLTKGWKSDAAPHPLFDPGAFRTRVPRAQNPACPLVQYIKNPRGMLPHYLFDEEHFREKSGYDLEFPGLLAYAASKKFSIISTHPLFDPDFYVTQVEKTFYKLTSDLKGAELKSFKDEFFGNLESMNTLSHYVKVGRKHAISPHRSFDTQYYMLQSGLKRGDDLLRHYLVERGMERFSPHPVIDLEHCRSQFPGFNSKVEPVYLHLMGIPRGNRPSPHPLFDRDFYAKTYDDVEKWDLCPVEHFLSHGFWEGRLPNAFYSGLHVDTKYKDEILYEHTALWEYFTRQSERPLKVLFVGHDATRTGAPLILLRLIEGMTKRYAIDAYTILGGGGDLTGDFAAASHVYAMKNGLDRGFLDGGEMNADWERELKSVASIFGVGGPDLVICNSAETRAFAKYMSDKKVPVVSLVHEAGDFYGSWQFSMIFNSSKLTIFPSKYTHERGLARAPAGENKVIIRGQGLLDPAFGTMSRAVARAVISERLNIFEDAVLVLGCGTADTRKGIDLFVEAATRMLKNPVMAELPLQFLWAGDYDPFAGPGSWARRRIEQLGLQDRIKFIGPQTDTEPFFTASDLFLMTSRMDPFPCVIHEAMAAGLPIIAFEGCSGAPEAFFDSGMVVPQEDAEAMAAEACGLLQDVDRRKAMAQRARDIVREKWRYTDYVADLGEEISKATGVTLRERSLAAPALIQPAERNTVYFSCPDMGISGVNTFTINLVEGLNARGFDARLLFTNGRHTYLPSAEHMPHLPSTFLPMTGEHQVANIWHQLVPFLTSHRPCIYVPNYDYVASAISPIVHPNVGVVGIAHSDDVEHYEHVDRLGRYWDRIVAVSKFIETEIVDLNPGLASKTSTIYYGVPFDEQAARRHVEARDYSADQPLVLTYTGRLVVQQKNIMAYTELAERLMEAGVPFRMNLVGDGSHYEILRAKLGGLIDAGIVNLPGRQTPAEVSEILHKTDVFTLLSDFEGLPLSMLEGMAIGVIPVIRDMKSGIREVVETGVSGYITPRHSIGAMVKVLKELQASPRQRKKMSHAVVDSFIRHRLSQSDMADSYQALFEGVFAQLRDRKKPRVRPLAYNAPLYGIAAPPFLTQR
jgi:glycosyltransferase involved in cell wall biosynthesis